MTPIGFLAGRVAAGAFFVVLATALGGCGQYDNLYMNNPAFTEGSGPNTKITGDLPPFDLQIECIPARRRNGKCDTATMAEIDSLAATDQEKATLLRDRLQDFLISRSDQKCERHRAGILAGQSSSDLGFDTVTTGVSAAAAVVVAPAANILAGIGAFTSGTHSHVNADVYQKYVAPAIVKKISDSRSEKLKEIQGKRSRAGSDAKQPLQPVPITEYTLEASIGDVERYNEYCSFSWGISALTDPNTKYGDTTAGIQQRIDLLRKQQLANSDQIKNIISAGGVPSNEDVRRLQDVNGDISRQIIVLQQQLFTAPQSVDPKPNN